MFSPVNLNALSVESFYEIRTSKREKVISLKKKKTKKVRKFPFSPEVIPLI